MLIFLLHQAAFLAADAWWWFAADRRVRRFRRGAQAWRALVAAWALMEMAYLSYFTFVSLSEGAREVGPMLWRVQAYVWHLMAIPLFVMYAATTTAIRAMWRRMRSSSNAMGGRGSARAGGSSVGGAGFGPHEQAGACTTNGAASASREPAAAPIPQPQWSRRRALAAAALPALAPALTAAVALPSLRRLGLFRTRVIEIPVPHLPEDLDGLRIVQLSDLHIGRFLPDGMIPRVLDAANALDADLVFFTGDLCDGSCKDIEPAIDFVNRLDARHGKVMIQGNHDGMNNADWWERPVRAAGLPLLQDESRIFRIPGRATPVQVFGTNWGELRWGWELDRHGRDRNRRFRKRTDETGPASIQRFLSQRAAGTFPIVLSHHPHLLDDAAAAGLPLVLAGHTHGGQIMLTEQIGAGPVRFKYWTGLYAKRDTRLFITNGLGNWFPVRLNAPAELAHLTLRRA